MIVSGLPAFTRRLTIIPKIAFVSGAFGWQVLMTDLELIGVA
jgi:hypothetical protein